MNVKIVLSRLARAITDEAERNPGFRTALQEALGVKEAPSNSTSKDKSASGRARNRRAAAVLDPVSVIKDGDLVLRNALAPLTLDQLQDIVSEYGMDSGKLVAKWKTASRIIDRIVEIATVRANKGHAFRKQAEEPIEKGQSR